MSSPSSDLQALLAPRSVAVIGASRRTGSIGHAIVRNLVTGGFTGALYPVHPTARAVHAIKCHPSVGAIPDPVDLAIVVVPRDAVAGVIEDGVAHRVRGFVVITAGFAESGDPGAALERQLLETVRGGGARMVGPNCMGVINTDPQVGLNATFAPIPARRGAIGFVSQSGALGVAILNVAAELGVGFTQFVSLGNQADISGNDLLELWEDDPSTRLVALYLESFGDPRRFVEIARRVARKKPVLMVKAGRTAEGARAASSHTGALAGSDVTVSTLLEQCGVQRAESIQDLFDVARAFDRCPLPAGRHLAIVTNAGGPGILATDACVALGLEMATLGDATRAALGAFLPRAASVSNPVDMLASAGAGDYRRAMAAVLADPSVDMVLVIYVTPLLAHPLDILEGVAAEMGTAPEKPVAAVVMAEESFHEATKTRRDLPPIYRFPEPAARGLAMLERYAAWRRRPPDSPAAFAVDDAAVAQILERRLGEHGAGWLDPGDAFRVLELYGVPVAPWRLARDAGEARRVAAELGFPVVVKAVAPDLVHKSDLGGVVLGQESSEQVSRTVRSIASRLTAAGHPPRSFLIQEEVQGGREVVFGASVDERFGPVLMFGLGGRYVEAIRDVRFGVTPLLPHEAGEMVRGLRGAVLLDGFRGEAPVDRALLEEILLRLAQLVERHPAIRELDVNPFLAAPERARARALDVRIRVAAPASGVATGGTAGDDDGAATAQLAQPASSERPSVLVVDDHPDVRDFLDLHLGDHYQVLLAAGGREGLELARRERPAVVLSDVMMPGMDGYALVRALRKEPGLSDVPVIFLTARDEAKDRLEGLGLGVDDYLTKPFDLAELRARVDNLIAGRERLRREWEHSAALAPEAVEAESADAAFLTRVRQTVEDGLASSDFNVDALASRLGMTRSHLFRRLRQLAGLTPSELIRKRRLERAEQLLRQRTASVSEIAFQVGFKSVSHFSQSFRERYGAPPSAWPPEGETL